MSERITGHTELIGLMAYPIRHSSSPAMQNEAFAKLGYDYAYLAFEVGAVEIQAALDGVGEIVIFNRKDEFWDRAVSTVEKINTRTSSHAVLYDLADLDQLKKEMADSYIFVNATGVGMKPLEGQSVVPDKSYFRPELIVVDVPYSPLETAMRSMAKEVGCKTMNGLGMMLFQGSAAFELWTGEPMPIEHMKEILNIRYDD